MTENKNHIRVLVVGRPNVGKTSLINKITGSNLKVGNFTGVTVETEEILFEEDGDIFSLIDTPGLYSINHPSSKDEEIVANLLKEFDKYDIILNIIDANKIDTDIMLTQEIIKKHHKKIILAFNCHCIHSPSVNIKKIEEDLKLDCIKISNSDKNLSKKILNKIRLLYHSDEEKTEKYKNLSVEILKFIKAKDICTRKKITSLLDNIFLNKILSLPIFLVLIFGIFKISFSTGGIFVTFINKLFFALSVFIENIIPYKGISSFINEGLISGLSTLFQFLPNIWILFFMINLMERSGYMARISFIMDTIMRFFGLTGRAVIPLIGGFSCSIPAYMATRILPSRVERIATMYAIGFMTCSAKFTFFVMIVGAIFPSNIAPYILFFIYLLSAIMGMIVAFFVTKALKGKKKKNIPFLVEMPDYHFPDLLLMIKDVNKRALLFIKKAGVFVIFFSLILHLGLKFGIIEQIAKTISPLFEPLGFDWRMNVALISGLFGKEVGAVTLGILYGGDLKSQISIPSAVSFITFFMLYLPCLSATFTFKKESKSNKDTVCLIMLTTAMAWIFSYFVYNFTI